MHEIAINLVVVVTQTGIKSFNIENKRKSIFNTGFMTYNQCKDDIAIQIISDNCYENGRKITEYREIPGGIKIPNHVYCLFNKYNCMVKYNRMKQ